MTVLFEDDLEADFTPYTNIYGGISISSTHVHHGLKSARVTAYGDSMRRILDVGYNLLYARTLFYFGTLPGLGLCSIILWTWDTVTSDPKVIVYNDAGVQKWGVGWNGSDNLIANFTLSAAPALTTGQWYDVQLKVERNVEARLYVNGVSLGVAPLIVDSQQTQFYVGDNAVWFGGLPHTNITYYADCAKVSTELIPTEVSNMPIVYPTVLVQEATKLPSTSSSPVTGCGGTRVRTLRHLTPISPWTAS